MERILTSLLVISAAIPCQAALYSGTTDTFNFFLRDSFAQVSASTGDSNVIANTTITTDFTTAQLGPTSIVSSLEFLGGLELSDSTFSVTNPTTLLPETFRVITTINSFETTLDFNPAPTIIIDDPFSGNFLLSNPTLAAASVDLQGSYRIEGPNTTVERNFSFGSDDALADDLLSTLQAFGGPGEFDLVPGTFNLPDSLRILPFEPSGFLIFNGNSRTDPAIFQEVVDGQTITNRLSSADFGFAFADLDPVPEPSTSISTLLALAFMMRRRR